MDKATTAAHAYLLRKHGYSKPHGRTDNGGRWYPHDDEKCPDCDRARSPSRAWPWTIFKHCFSLNHVALSYGADPKEVRSYTNKKKLPLLMGISENGDKIIEEILKGV
jgi:hypothetical protein